MKARSGALSVTLIGASGVYDDPAGSGEKQETNDIADVRRVRVFGWCTEYCGRKSGNQGGVEEMAASPQQWRCAARRKADAHDDGHADSHEGKQL